VVSTAWALLTRGRCVLFDFDGPICDLFPEDSSRPLADELRLLVADSGLTDLLTERERTDKDPHLVLRAIHRARWKADLRALGAKEGDLVSLVERLERRLTRGELAAARIAEPPPSDAKAFIRGLPELGLRLAVVTNNSPLVAESYLKDHGLHGHFEFVHGRTTDPDLMKPHPYVLKEALRSLRLAPEDAVMIGDTETDLQAAGRAGVRFIGYDRNPVKRSWLLQAGADVVLESYAPLPGVGVERGAHEPGVGVVGGAARR
jgi:HAD superfamily hydrolase (TIGR01509 family)